MKKNSGYLFGLVIIIPLFVFCNNSGNLSSLPATGSGNGEQAVQPTGAIAFIRNSTEIRVIDSNGQHDHRIWTDPDINSSVGIHDLAWRPDGKELAFSSGHEILYSLYDADLYCIHPDGTGLRKITNAPDKKELGQYKKGVVTVTFRNNQSFFEHTKASEGVFFVTMTGADDPQMITLPPGSAKTITFKAVADFGKGQQPIIVMNGTFRWLMPGIKVGAGQTKKAPDFIIKGNGTEYFGAYHPVWKQDGSELSFRNGFCAVQAIAAYPSVNELQYNPVFKGENAQRTCAWDYGPATTLADKLIYTENTGEGTGIFIQQEGGRHDPSTLLVQFADVPDQVLNDLKWLPDGSGFLYSTESLINESANIFRYDMKTKQTRQLTPLQGEYAKRFCISPNGKWVVYEKRNSNGDDSEVNLWLMNIDGTNQKLLVKNGACPSWSK